MLLQFVMVVVVLRQWLLKIYNNYEFGIKNDELMSYEKGNIIVTKSFQFSLHIFDLYQSLIELKHYDLARQVFKSGTSIGANIKEAQRAVSKKDFINKLGISLKEADETQYWFDLINLKVLKIENSLMIELDKIIRLLVSIIKTAKNNS